MAPALASHFIKDNVPDIHDEADFDIHDTQGAF